jgi:hypothetical protein
LQVNTRSGELEVAPNVPRDWRDFINEFPTIKGIAVLCILCWVLTPIVIAGLGVWGFATSHEPTPGLLHVLDSWLSTLNWFTPFAIGGVVGKRLSENPDVIVAEAQAKATTAAATAALNSGSGDADPTMRPQ